jgi:hypothetical protein
LPLGIGFTTNPAADVKGVKVFGSDDLETKLSDEDDSKDDANSASAETEVSTSSSQLTENHVETNINIISNKIDSQQIAASENFEKEKNEKENNKMLIKSIHDLNDDSLKQVCATDIRSLFEEEIKKASEKFSEEQAAKDSVIAEAEKTKAELESQLEQLREVGEQLKAELEKIKNEAEARELHEAFQNRMATLDEEFSLDDEDRQAIGEQIKNLDQDSFEKWYKAFNVFAKGKNKKMMMEKKAAQEKMKQDGCASSEEESAEVIASEQDKKEQEAAIVLEKVQAQEIALPNGAVAEESLRQKFAKAFNSSTIKIQVNN